MKTPDPDHPVRNTLKHLALGAVAALAFAIPAAHADLVINVDFNTTTTSTYVGTGAVPDLGTVWNGLLSSASNAALLDSAGATTSVTLTVGSAFGFNAGPGNALFNDYLYNNGNSTTTTSLAGLTAGSAFSLYLYATGDQSPQATTFTLSAANGGASASTTLSNRTDFVLGENYVVLNGNADSSGNISFNWTAAPSTTQFGVLNGLQLVVAGTGAPDETPPTPSPMTWASEPVATSSSSITMTATTASDASGVQYFFTETTGNPGGTSSIDWQDSPTYIDTGLSASTAYTYTVIARDKSSARNETLVSSAASATTNPPPSGSVVWNVNIGNQVTTADNYAGAVPQSSPIHWNSITASSYTGLALMDSTGSATGGITLDLTSNRDPGGVALTSGDKIFVGFFGNGGAASSMILRGLTVAKTYDILFYSDYYWKDGDSLPITQTAGSGLTGTFFLNRILSGTYGTVPELTPDTNPANVTSGTGNIGNYCRIVGIVPDLDGKVSFRIGDGANTAFNGFQLVQTGDVAPRADMLRFELASNPPSIREAAISGTNITLTMPYGSDVSALAPTFTLWPGATCIPVSGTARDFSTPRTYMVTSSDSLITKNYIASVAFAPPLPEFTLNAPANWDGRQTITVQPDITNLALLQANNGTNFTYQWSVSGVAVTRQVSPGVLTLTRSQGSGPLVVTLTMANGTEGVTESTTIQVQEPATDPWVERMPAANEKPVDGQFFARNPFTNLGTIFYRGTESGSPDTVFLKVYRTPDGGAETLDAEYRQPLAGGAYAFAAPVEAGLFTYRAVYGTTTGGTDTVVATVTDLVCGDAYIINGQSNAVATDNSEPQVDTSYPWIYTYNATLGWRPAYAKPTSPNWDSKIGFWAMKLARDIVAQHSMPVCIINGAAGGTRIDMHQPNPADHSLPLGSGWSEDLYANLLNRVIAAKLTHGIRGIFWHQGENNSGTDAPQIEPDYLSYQKLFLDLSAAWKQDYPNFQSYIIFQVMPKPCGMGPYGDQLRETQRTLPFQYSKMSILNTLGFGNDGGCHFTKAGYESIAGRILPVVNRDFYGIVPGAAVTAPNLKRAYFTSAARTAIALEFDQPMTWSSFSMPNYYVDDVGGIITSGSASGNIITLQLSSAASANATLDYLKDSIWNLGESVSSLLYGANGIPALTFADVPIGTPGPYEVWAGGSFANAFTDTDPSHDPDLDGMTNQEEFAFGLDPTTGSSVNPITQQLDKATGIFKYTRTKDSGLTYKVYYSTTLSGWALDAAATQSPATAVAGIETVTVTLAAAVPRGDKLFVRVEATPTP